MNYDQIETKKHIPEADACRGLILDKYNYTPLCRSFDRFYNYGEDPNSDNFPIQDSTVTEKIDGSLIRFWFYPYDDQWCCSTRKCAFGEGETRLGRTFTQVVENTIGTYVNSFMSKHFPLQQDKMKTYIFELVSPETRVVKPYKTNELYLLAIRDNITGEYASLNTLQEVSEMIGIRLPKRFTFNNISNVLNSMKELPALDEGYVVEYNDWRIKIKNPSYLAVAHIRNNGILSIQRIWYLVVTGVDTEYLNYFPEDLQYFTKYQIKLSLLKKEITETYMYYKDIVSQKDFALAIKGLPYVGILFSMRKGKTLQECLESSLQNGKVSPGFVDMMNQYNGVSGTVPLKEDSLQPVMVCRHTE